MSIAELLENHNDGNDGTDYLLVAAGMASVLKCPGRGEDLYGRQANRRSFLHRTAARIVATNQQKFFDKTGTRR